MICFDNGHSKWQQSVSMVMWKTQNSSWQSLRNRWQTSISISITFTEILRCWEFCCCNSSIKELFPTTSHWNCCGLLRTNWEHDKQTDWNYLSSLQKWTVCWMNKSSVTFQPTPMFPTHLRGKQMEYPLMYAPSGLHSTTFWQPWRLIAMGGKCLHLLYWLVEYCANATPVCAWYIICSTALYRILYMIFQIGEMYIILNIYDALLYHVQH